jgi:hypothetical protein
MTDADGGTESVFDRAHRLEHERVTRTTDPFIVAEVSKNWRNGVEVTPGSGLLAQQFERVMLVNAGRGYRLLQFQLHRTMTGPDELNETIIAVFERR